MAGGANEAFQLPALMTITMKANDGGSGGQCGCGSVGPSERANHNVRRDFTLVINQFNLTRCPKLAYT